MNLPRPVRKLIESFEKVQRIPYMCRRGNPLEVKEELTYANCSKKRGLLKQILDSFGFECRKLDAIFDWSDLPIPTDILKILRNSGTFQKHHLLEVKINENYFKIDTTWNLELEWLGFPVTKDWDGNSDTEQITKGAILFYNPNLQKVSLPYFQEERIRFADEFNKWLGWKL